jgi:glucose-1-phosphate cytidylyltransferase
MKVVILCGGKGTRLSEETVVKPKPLVEVGNHPILWHIMNHYAKYGFKEFVLALGYKSELIKEYFLNFYSRDNNFEIDLSNGEIKYLSSQKKDWKVTLIDTGAETLTGGRLLRLKPYLNSSFMLTYGDGISNVNISKLREFHLDHKKIATVTSVRPAARFGEMKISSNQVINFQEKPQASEGWINGGFFVFNPEIFNYLEDDETILEKSPLENLCKDNQLMAFQHNGYWQCMDTLRDKSHLNELWESGKAPWLFE